MHGRGHWTASVMVGVEHGMAHPAADKPAVEGEGEYPCTSSMPAPFECDPVRTWVRLSGLVSSGAGARRGAGGALADQLAPRPEPPRSRGSRTSRSASPSMLNPNTASEMAAPGNSAIQGA